MSDVASIVHPIITAVLAIITLWHTFLRDKNGKSSVAEELVALRLQDINDIKIRLSVLEERTKNGKS
jgi:hypothetical protein